MDDPASLLPALEAATVGFTERLQVFLGQAEKEYASYARGYERANQGLL